MMSYLLYINGTLEKINRWDIWDIWDRYGAEGTSFYPFKEFLYIF
jgi:hypothetical protein